MKNLKKLFLPVLVTPFLLLGCAGKAPQAQNNVAPNQQPAVQEQEQVPAEEGRAVPTSRYGANMKCSQLKEVTKQQECEVSVNDIIGDMLESEIMSTFDIDRCKELPDEIAKDCQDRLSVTGVKGPVSAEELAKFSEITRGTPSENPEQPEVVYDSTRCAELSAAGYKEYCEQKVNEHADREKMAQIMRAEDKTGCDKLTTETAKNDCKRFFGEEVVEEAPVLEEAPVEEVEVPAPEANE